jgi:hypothetical protein
MNKQKEFEDDILARYITPGKIEKAPEGITGRVMSRIRMEKIPESAGKSFLLIHKIPVISFLIILGLISAAVIVSSTGKQSPLVPALKPLVDLVNELPKFNFGKISGITIPVWSVYTMIGIFFLFIFDLALGTFFGRERKEGKG